MGTIDRFPIQTRVLDKSAIGLGNVDNTSDMDKPVSTATQAAINSIVPLQNPDPLMVTGGSVAVDGQTLVIAVSRAAPTLTSIQLPATSLRERRPVRVTDWSTSVTEHEIRLIAASGETVMLLPSLSLFSNSIQLSGITLYPSSALSGWYIAP